MSEVFHILIVEDEPAIAELLQFTLQGGGYRTAVAHTAQAARDEVARSVPHLVLLDWMLPDGSGIALLREWRAARATADMRVVMLTAKGLDEDKVTGLNAGADDYVTKPFSPRELLARLRAMLREVQRKEEACVKSFGMLRLDEDRHVLTAGDLILAIGQVEFRMLSFLMDAPGRIFSRKHLLDLVWGDHSVLEERTVDVHIMRLRKSLGPAASYLKTVRNAGYRLVDDESENI